jgi:hypothetical protein
MMGQGLGALDAQQLMTQQGLAQQQQLGQNLNFPWPERPSWARQVMRWRERQAYGFDRGALSLPEEPT